MKRAELAAEALAIWTIGALKTGTRSILRQELPEFDLETFFTAIAREEGFAIGRNFTCHC